MTLTTIALIGLSGVAAEQQSWFKGNKAPMTADDASSGYAPVPAAEMPSMDYAGEMDASEVKQMEDNLQAQLDELTDGNIDEEFVKKIVHDFEEGTVDVEKYAKEAEQAMGQDTPVMIPEELLMEQEMINNLMNSEETMPTPVPSTMEPVPTPASSTIVGIVDTETAQDVEIDGAKVDEDKAVKTTSSASKVAASMAAFTVAIVAYML